MFLFANCYNWLMPKMIDLTGLIFGHLIVLSQAQRPEGKKSSGVWWNVRCVCGKEYVVNGSPLRTGETKSCGCISKPLRLARMKAGIARKHGFTTDRSSAEYHLYMIRDQIKGRCYRQAHKDYQWYGARGIRVCAEWLNDPVAFITWALSNGYRKGLEVDRRNNEGDYEPSNCHFVTHKENCNNRRSNLAYKQRMAVLCATS